MSCAEVHLHSQVSTSLHADDEDTLDHTQPICNLTIGSSRSIEFVTKENKPKPVCNILMKNRSVVHMKPGTQEKLKHMVRGDTRKKRELRFSLSFRALAKKPADTNSIRGPNVTLSAPNTPTANVTSQLAKASQPSPQSNVVALTQKRHVCLIAGDSFAARLDTQKLGRQAVLVESVARGGASMHHVMGQLKAYATSHADTVVEKICISVGTNDIRYCRGVSHLSLKFKSLCLLIKEIFPHSKVFFQLLLPLPCLHRNDWITNSKVIEFNRIIVNACIFNKFCVSDAFAAFSAPRKDFWSPELRDYRLFKGSDIHPSEARGMGVLARLYIRAIHSRFYNPFVYQ